jgi:hypothetical protein
MKMNACEKYIEDLEGRLPELCRPDHLVKMGIFKYRQSADLARKEGKGPDFFKLGRKVFYPREGILKWLKDNSHVSGEETDTTENWTDSNV